MLRTDAQGNILRLHIVGGETLLLVLAQLHLHIGQLDEVLAVLLQQLGIEEVHLGGADKAGDKQVPGIVEHFLGGADLLDIAIPHDDDAVAQGHGLGLVMGDVDKGCIDTFAQLDDLGAHLVTELGVQVGQRLVHQEDGRVADDGAADGHTLALAAGQGLGLAVQILGNVQDLGSLADLLVDHFLLFLAQLQGEGHVFIHGHMGVQGVVLENHGDVSVLGGHIVHELAVNVQLAFGDLLQTGHHTQRGGLAAAGGAYQNDEFLIGNVQVELLNRHNALIGDLKVDLLLFRLVLTLFLFLLAFAADERVDLLYVFQCYSCHFYRL